MPSNLNSQAVDLSVRDFLIDDIILCARTLSIYLLRITVLFEISLQCSERLVGRQEGHLPCKNLVLANILDKKTEY